MTQNYDPGNIQACGKALLSRSQNRRYAMVDMKDSSQVVEALNIAKALQAELLSRYSDGVAFEGTEEEIRPQKIAYATKRLSQINAELGNSGSEPIHTGIFQKEVSHNEGDVKVNPDSLNLAIRVIETYHTIESKKQKLRQGPRLEDIL